MSEFIFTSLETINPAEVNIQLRGCNPRAERERRRIDWLASNSYSRVYEPINLVLALIAGVDVDHDAK